MKPKPYASVLEMLKQGDKPPAEMLPYDTYLSEKPAFITFAVLGKFIAFPLHSIGNARLGEAATAISLDFGPTLVTISGQKLDDLFEEILLGRIRVIRTGKHKLCAVDAIQICDAIVH